jgi:ElaB/YqjD/DUF883 family membrane-anchored ribosome-binding protein
MAVSNNPSSQGMGHHTENPGSRFGEAKEKVQDVADKARSTAAQVANKAYEGVANLTDKAREGAANLTDKAREGAANLTDKAREGVANLSDKAREGAANLTDKADDAISNVGQKMTSLAGQLRENAPREGMIGNAASAVADNLQAGGRFLQEHRIEDVGEEATQMIRRHPVPSVLVAFGIGCLLGISLSRR